MTYRRFFWGFIFVFIGILFVLRNVGMIYFSCRSILNLWPLLLVIWGISLLPIRNTFKLLISMIIIILSLMFYKHYADKDILMWSNKEGIEWYDDNEDDTDNWDESWDTKKGKKNIAEETYEDNGDVDNEVMNIAYEQVKCATLNFDAGVGKISLDTPTHNDLILLKKTGKFSKYSLQSEKRNSCQVVTLKTQQKKKSVISRSSIHNIHMKLHPKPVWEMNFDVGAADISLDLSPYKIKELQIEGGVSNIELTFGDKMDESFVEIDAGASNILLNVPKNIGTSISFESVLTTKNLDGFVKRGDTYYSENYQRASKKLHFDIEAAISNIDVDRY